MTLETRQTQNQHVAICLEHPSYSIGWQLVFSSQSTTNGNANGSTLIDTTRDSGAANTYNGRWWVRCTSGSNKGIMKRVLDDDGAGTLTFEGTSDSDGFPNQVAGNVSYELWKSPEPVVLVDSSANGQSVLDGERDEPDDFWEGHWMVPLTGNRRGQKSRITGFVSSSGTFTLAPGFDGALAAGDVCVLRRYIDVTAIRNGLTNAFNPRPLNRLDGGKPDGSVGPKAGTFGFDARVVTGVDAGGSTILPPPLAPAIQACGFKEFRNNAATGDATESGSTTTGIEIGTGSWENFTIGGLVSVEGEMAFLTGQTDGGGAEDTLTVTPALGLAPDAAATMPATWCYRRNRRGADSDYFSCTIEYEVDGIRTIMTGCKGNLTISGEEELMMSFEFNVDHWVREKQVNCVDYLGDAYSTENPIQGYERRCYVGATAVDLGAISASLNNEVTPRKVQGAYGINGRAGFAHARCNPGVTARKLAVVESGEHLPADEEWFSRTTLDLMIFWGTSIQGGFALRIPVGKLVADPKLEDDDGAQAFPYVIEATDAGSTTDPDSTVVRVPDMVIGFA